MKMWLEANKISMFTTISQQNNHFTNSEFIAIIADKLRLKNKVSQGYFISFGACKLYKVQPTNIKLYL